jgi:hypothetical protein
MIDPLKDELVTLEEVAAKYEVSTKTVRLWAKPFDKNKHLRPKFMETIKIGPKLRKTTWACVAAYFESSRPMILPTYGSQSADIGLSLLRSQGFAV